MAPRTVQGQLWKLHISIELGRDHRTTRNNGQIPIHGTNRHKLGTNRQKIEVGLADPIFNVKTQINIEQ